MYLPIYLIYLSNRSTCIYLSIYTRNTRVKRTVESNVAIALHIFFFTLVFLVSILQQNRCVQNIPIHVYLSTCIYLSVCLVMYLRTCTFNTCTYIHVTTHPLNQSTTSQSKIVYYHLFCMSSCRGQIRVRRVCRRSPPVTSCCASCGSSRMWSRRRCSRSGRPRGWGGSTRCWIFSSTAPTALNTRSGMLPVKWLLRLLQCIISFKLTLCINPTSYYTA